MSETIADDIQSVFFVLDPDPDPHFRYGSGTRRAKTMSVSRFQEKEKGGEMITINDNKNDNIK